MITWMTTSLSIRFQAELVEFERWATGMWDNVVGLERNTPHDPCTIMTTLASVDFVEQSWDQGPLSSFLTQLVGKVVADVVEFCAFWSTCALSTYLFQGTVCISASYHPLCYATCTPQVSNRRTKANRARTLPRSV